MRLGLKRIRNSRKYICTTAAKWTASIYAFIGLLSLFASFEAILGDKLTFCCELLISLAILVAVWLLCAVVIVIIVVSTRKVKVLDGYNQHSVYAVYGNLFDEKLIEGQKRYIAFSVNRCFDTIVNDRLISSTTIHGKAFSALYATGIYNEMTLDSAIQRAMPVNTPFQMLTVQDKPEGNLKRYPAGTCVNMEINDTTHYLLLGMPFFDENLRSQTSRADFAISLQKLVEAIDIHSQGYPVLLPIIGAGRSRTDLTENEALRYMIEVFRLNREKIKSDIYIVVPESAKDRIPIINLKAL